MIYDETAGYVETPHGMGKWVGYDPITHEVVVEMDYEWLVRIPGEQCYVGGA